MNTQTSRLMAAALLTIGVTTTALAQTPVPAKPPAQTDGQGLMGTAGTEQGNSMMGSGTMGGNGGSMMGMMSAMTRMANTCNRTMENASIMQPQFGKAAAGPSKG